MSDRTSHVFDGVGSALAATYSTGVSSTTSAMNTQPYNTLLVYVSVTTVTGSGKATVYVDCSYDGETWFPLNALSASGSTEVPTLQGALLGSASTDYCIPFQSVGKFSRVRIAYSSGTSLVVDACTIEAKS